MKLNDYQCIKYMRDRAQSQNDLFTSVQNIVAYFGISPEDIDDKFVMFIWQVIYHETS